MVNPRKVLKEAVRVTKPEGIIYISVPAFIEYTETNPEHVRFFSEKSLIELLKRCKELDLETLRWYNRPRLKGLYRLAIKKQKD